MEKQKDNIRRFGFALCMVSFFLTISCTSDVTNDLRKPAITKGILSLESWNFTDDGPVHLTGEWEFYWKELLTPEDFSKRQHEKQERTDYVTVPSNWEKTGLDTVTTDGYATYKCTVLLPPGWKGKNLCLELPEQSSAFRCYVNDTVLHESGVVGTGPSSSSAQYLPTVKSFSVEDQRIDIVLHISNFHHRSGGFWAPLLLGTENRLVRTHSLKTALDAFLLGSILIMAIYHAVLFIIRREEKAMLFFSLFCIAISIRLAVTGQFLIMQLFPDFPWSFLKKTEFLTETASIALFTLFLRRLYPVEFHKFVEYLFLISCALYSIVCIVVPIRPFMETAIITAVLTTLLGVYSIYLMIQLTIRQREGSFIFLAGILFLLFGAAHDIILAQVNLYTFYLFPSMLVCFFISQSILLSKRFAKAFSKAERQLENFLLTLASAIESKDKYTGGHVERVANYARDVANHLPLNPEEVRRIYLGAIIHDIGKLGIPDNVLNKGGKLTDEEFEIIKQHTVRGKELLGKIEDIETAIHIALYHQERWDGRGYPTGISGFTIPLAARVTALADYWDAITTDRPYRKAMQLEKALSIMNEERGRAFDPELFDIFMRERLFLRYLNERQQKEYKQI